ncbi:L-2-hydroxyglutarate oxidase [Rhodopirellula bahusiensis]|uniref:Hydroxyglutarate oxidase n=1 Tax=Rhodopirellula bahusiensis TaxID=2014065 RepID=A0A2G1W0M7_9BACT|nr:L-2-hydroxyglutarate oxidase [Rhodopirellula bahusiensis]PHQ32583.1 hydroxyglutarate oxidase [Rhodopirellula bahusiensis]
MKHSFSPARDLAVIGGGIVGLATAMTWLQTRPGSRVTVLETEARVGQHQSGHNSGVIHSGIYYQPGSEKALLCREGKTKLEAFCEKHGIRWEKCGKVVVATDPSELSSLERIIERADLNGVEFRRITIDQLRQLEPSVAGVDAIVVPETGIVDYRSVCDAYRHCIEEMGGSVQLGFQVQRLDADDSGVRLAGVDHNQSSRKFDIRARSAIACAGLHSDTLVRQSESDASRSDTESSSEEVRIIPFRGEYYELRPERRGLCRNLIYPVPDPAFPFLGVHFTRMIDGNVECGPNAVLALAREGYRWRDIDVRYLQRTLGYSGFRRLIQKHWRKGLGEMNRSLRKSAFVSALQKLIPELRASDLIPARAGVRAQAVRANGELVDDFLFRSTPNVTHVLNAPSPAATASLAIARRVIEQHQKQNPNA